MDEVSVTRTAPPLTRSLATDHASAEVHHTVPRCLLRLYDRVSGYGPGGEFIEAWLEFELEALIEGSAAALKREAHRLLHRDDWRRWGSRGGRETLRRYGSSWFALLALRRWGRINAEELEAARPLR